MLGRLNEVEASISPSDTQNGPLSPVFGQPDAHGGGETINASDRQGERALRQRQNTSLRQLMVAHDADAS